MRGRKLSKARQKRYLGVLEKTTIGAHTCLSPPVRLENLIIHGVLGRVLTSPVRKTSLRLNALCPAIQSLETTAPKIIPILRMGTKLEIFIVIQNSLALNTVKITLSDIQ